MPLTQEKVDNLEPGDVVVMSDSCYLVVTDLLTDYPYKVLLIDERITQFQICSGTINEWKTNFKLYGIKIININNLYKVLKDNS